ncbi:MAG TPA: transketolase [Edaphocola sp.]|nr:transketolase [Edaphocola sp.]
MELQALKDMATQVRRDIVRMVHAVQSGHPGGSLGCTEYLVALYFKEMKHNPEFHMEAKDEDVFFLSNGHISPVFYSVLARSGYFPVSELGTFRKLNSRLQGHPATHEGLPGVRIASGSLGQGLSVASGMALAKKMNQDSSFVFALTGDGELQEGQNWEAIMFAAHHKLDNLIVAVDYNGQQIDGPTHMVLHLGDLKSKFEAFGWEVQTIEKGNDMESVVKGIQAAKAASGNGKPICILLKTEMGAGVSFMEGTHKWHGIAPNDEQLAQALSELPETLGDY